MEHLEFALEVSSLARWTIVLVFFSGGLLGLIVAMLIVYLWRAEIVSELERRGLSVYRESLSHELTDIQRESAAVDLAAQRRDRQFAADMQAIRDARKGAA